MKDKLTCFPCFQTFCSFTPTKHSFTGRPCRSSHQQALLKFRCSPQCVYPAVKYQAHKEYTAALIIPTGIGAKIGGFAGDGLPTARAFASIVDCLIAHPNILNGALMYWPMENVLYVEGFGLDQFFSGHWGLRPVSWNRVGIVLDCGIEEELLYRHLQCVDAARATLGLAVTDYTLTDKALKISTFLDQDGASSGMIDGMEDLIQASNKLIEKGCDAIAIVTRFPEDDETLLEAYRHAKGVDAIGGAEALISRQVAKACQVPCAHAPALSSLPLDKSIDPKAAAEELGYTFLSSVLVGLSRAPRYVTGRQYSQVGDMWCEALDAVILPQGTLNTCSIQQLYDSKTTFFLVEENETTMKWTPQNTQNRTNIIITKNYLEALGYVAAHKAGVLWEAMTSHVRPVQPYHTSKK